MIIEGIDPVAFTIGPLAVRWYGIMFALSIAAGMYYLHKHGLKQGYSEDDLVMLVLVAVICVIIGARAVFVLTNRPSFTARPVAGSDQELCPGR